MDDESTRTMEQKIADLQAKDAANDVRMEQILAALSTLLRLSQHTSEIPSTPSPATQLRVRTIRPVTPPEFDGDRTKGMAFLNSCQTYIRLCPEEFLDEQTKIVWAMSYMKAGRAQKWTARVFRWEQHPDNLGQDKFLDWDKFCTEFQKEFTPAHADTLAIHRLESTAYYQRARSLDDYIDEFQDLIADSGYTDPKTIVVKFRRGLNSQIQNAVATMASGRPSNAIPSEWYSMARTVDQNHAANEAFSSMHRPPAPLTHPIPTSVQNPVLSAKPGHSHILPTPGNPVPMDLDVSRKTSTNPLCFRCKGPGHFGKDCPTRFNVRTMTLDELQEVLDIRLAQLDVATSDSPPPPEPQNHEDFHPDSE